MTTTPTRPRMAQHGWNRPEARNARGGGAGRIPLRRPYDWLAAGPVVLVGSSGCQIYAGNASGVGLGLVAARLLAQAMADHPADPALGAWAYASRFHRRYSPFLTGVALMFRLFRELGTEAIQAFVESGLFSPSLASQGLENTLGFVGLREWRAIVEGAIRERRYTRHRLRLCRRRRRSYEFCGYR